MYNNRIVYDFRPILTQSYIIKLMYATNSIMWLFIVITTYSKCKRI